MAFIRRIGESLVNAVSTTNDGKPPPDEALVACRSQLAELRDEIMQIRQQFASYAESLLQSSELSVVLGKSIVGFYEGGEHPGRTKSVQTYYQAQEEMATRATNLFQDQLHSHDGVVNELDNWLQAIRMITAEIEDCERSRQAAAASSARLDGLQEQFAHKSKQAEKLKEQGKQGGRFFGGSAAQVEQELKELRERMERTEEVKRSLTKDFKQIKEAILHKVRDMRQEKYRMFDSVYVQVLEAQHSFFKHTSELTLPFEKAITYYRQRYPRSSATRPSQSNQSTPPASPHADSTSLQRHDTAEDIIGGITSTGELKKRRRSSLKVKTEGNGTPLGQQTRRRGKTSPANPLARNLEQQITGSPRSVDKRSTLQPQRPQSAANATKSQAHQPKPPNSAGTQAPQDELDFLHGFGDFTGAAEPVAHSAPPASSLQQPSFDLFGEMTGAEDASQPQPQPGAPQQGQPKHPQALHERDMSIGSFFSGMGSGQSTARLETMASVLEQEEMDATRMGSEDFMTGLFADKQEPSMAFGQGSKSHPGVEVRHSGSQSAGQLNSQFRRQQQGQGQQQALTPHATRSPVANGSYATKSPAPVTQTTVEERVEFVNEEYRREKAEQQARRDAHDKYESKIDEWEFKEGHTRRNIRSLLSKLHELLWEGSKWKKVTIVDLTNPNQCRKHYQKALRVVHPDRSSNRGDSPERKVICERAFTALNEAWAEFEKTLG